MTTGKNADDSTKKRAESEMPWHRRPAGLAVVAGYAAITVGVILASTGYGGLVDAERAVPGDVYLFATAGAVGYVLTTLIKNFDRTVGDLLRIGLRIPAALLLSLGVYLLASVSGIEAASSPRLVGGLAFLTGLYVNVTFARLGKLADRLYPD